MQEQQYVQKLIELVLKNAPNFCAAILEKQILASQIRIESYSYGYKVLFVPDCNSLQLPPWLPLKCFEWQCLTQDAPITCEVFLDSEHRIAEIFILDYSFEVLRWDVVWDKVWEPSHEYDASKLIAKFSCANLLIQKKAVGTIAGQIVAKINIIHNEDDTGTVLCFWGCKNGQVEIPVRVSCTVSITKADDPEYPFVIFSDEKEILRCKAVYETYDNLM